MRIKEFPLTPGNKLSILLIVLVLSVIGVIQYRWFARSAASEIEQTYRSIYTTVFRTAGREFQRYSVMLNDLPPSENNKMGTAQVKRYLEKLFAAYGPEGATPDLIKSAGFSLSENPETVQAYTGPENGWIFVPNDIIMEDSLILLERLKTEKKEILFAEKGYWKDSILILSTAGEIAEYLIIYEIDLNRFFQQYIRPAILAELPDCQISLEIVRGAALESSRIPGNYGLKTYKFYPLRVLAGRKRDSLKELSLPLPRFPDFLRGGAGKLKPDMRFFRPVIGNFKDPGRVQPGNAYDYVHIRFTKGSLTDTVERRLAINWLAEMVLLWGVGIAFIFLVLQMNRLRLLRLKEKEFVASITHELRTPLTVIQSAADNLSNGIVPENRITQYGSFIKEQTLRLGGMVEKVLLYSQIEGNSGQIPVLDTVVFSTWIPSLKKALEPLSFESGVTITWNTGALPRECISDPESLHFIVTNLVTNSVHHAYKGKDSGEIRIAARLSLPDNIIFKVEDDGRGITPADGEKIFDPFYRDKTSRENHERGTGLGLFIASRKAEILGGTLSYKSPYERADGQARQGCQFILKIPYIHKESYEKGIDNRR